MVNVDQVYHTVMTCRKLKILMYGCKEEKGVGQGLGPYVYLKIRLKTFD